MKRRWLWMFMGLVGCTQVIYGDGGVGDGGNDSGIMERDLGRGRDGSGGGDLWVLADLSGGGGMDLGTPDGGLVLRGTFIGGGVMANAGTWALRGGFVWHGAIVGSAGGYVLRGWLR